MSAIVHVRILRQDANACLQLPTSLKMPSGQGGQSAIVAHYTPERLANNGVHTVKIPQDLRRAAVPDAALTTMAHFLQVGRRRYPRPAPAGGRGLCCGVHCIVRFAGRMGRSG